VAMARFESDQELKAQLVARDQQLAERKRIEQAKGLLMKMKDCNEEQAYTLMRRQAMSRHYDLASPLLMQSGDASGSAALARWQQ